MNEDLLHHLAEEVLLLGVGTLGQDPLEVVDEGGQHLPVDRGEYRLLPAGLKISLLRPQFPRASP